jgi:hypothetical protein
MATHVFWSPFVIPLTSKFHQTNNTKMILTKELVAKQHKNDINQRTGCQTTQK